MGFSMIRIGIEEDIPRIVEMLSDMKDASRYIDDEFCHDTCVGVALGCIESSMLSVLEVDGVVQGFAGGIIGTLLFNRDIKSGTELAWWVDPNHRELGSGVELLSHIEGLARVQGVKHWNMVYQTASMPEVVKAIYEKMGYTQNEIVYSRVL